MYVRKGIYKSEWRKCWKLWIEGDRMKVCIVSHEYTPNIVSGLGTALVMLTEGLVNNGFDVTIVTPRTRGGKPHEKSRGLDIFRIDIDSSTTGRIPDSRIAFSNSLKEIKKEFDFTDFDILHIYDVHDSYFLDNKIKENVSIIISVNDFYSYITPLNIFRFPYPCENLVKRYLHYTYTRHMNKKYLKMADLVVSNTKYVRDVLTNKNIVSGDKIKTVYRAMNPKRFSVGKNKYNSHEILYIGNNMERKGVVYLLQSMSAILKEFPDSKLTIVGTAQKGMEKKMLSLIEKCGIKKNIELIPFMNSDDVANKFSTANVFVLPAIIENLAVVLLEAMASSTPVVCTDTGANKEAVRHDCGFIIESKNHKSISDSILNIFRDPELAMKMGSNGKKRIDNEFSQKRMINGIINIYKEFK